MICGCVSVSRSLLPFRSHGVIVEQVAAVMVLVQPVALDHGAHGTVQDQDALLEELAQKMDAIGGHRVGAKNKKPGRVARSGFCCCPAL